MGINLIDRFSYLHFCVGVIFFYWNIDIVTSFILHTIFETVENTKFGMKIINKYFTLWPGGKPHADSYTNILGDTIFFILGWYSAYILKK